MANMSQVGEFCAFERFMPANTGTGALRYKLGRKCVQHRCGRGGADRVFLLGQPAHAGLGTFTFYRYVEL